MLRLSLLEVDESDRRERPCASNFDSKLHVLREERETDDRSIKVKTDIRLDCYKNNDNNS